MKHNIVGDTVDDQGNTSDSLESSGEWIDTGAVRWVRIRSRLLSAYRVRKIDSFVPKKRYGNR